MISICMPHYNRWDRLQDTLDSYNDLYKGFDMEVCICDDGSDELKELKCDFPLFMVALPQSPPLNPCVPTNMAVRMAHGDRIILTCPEVIHVKPVIYSMLETQTDPFDYVSVTVTDSKRKLLTGPNHGRRARAPYPEGSELPFCALMSKVLYWTAGGYDEDYRNGRGFDDNDFLWRLERAGANFKTAPGVVHHVHEPIKWKLPSNEKLFREKWPDLYSS